MVAKNISTTTYSGVECPRMFSESKERGICVEPLKQRARHLQSSDFQIQYLNELEMISMA